MSKTPKPEITATPLNSGEEVAWSDLIKGNLVFLTVFLRCLTSYQEAY